MHELVEEAEKLRDKFENDLEAIADRRMALVVEEFRRRFPKRELRMVAGNGGVCVWIDDRYFDWDDVELGYTKKLRDYSSFPVPCFKFIGDAVKDVDAMFGRNDYPLFTEIISKPRKEA